MPPPPHPPSARPFQLWSCLVTVPQLSFAASPLPCRSLRQTDEILFGRVMADGSFWEHSVQNFGTAATAGSLAFFHAILGPHMMRVLLIILL